MPDRDPDVTVRALLENAVRALSEAHTSDDARSEAALLLAHVLQRDRAWLIAHDDASPDAWSRARYAELIGARVAGTPVAYLLGERAFWSLSLRVSPAVLIPRADTELLVELALARLLPDAGVHDDVDVIDLGTGSGAIALAVAKERPHVRVLATDASVDALEIARINAQAIAVRNVSFAHGDWWAAAAGRRFALALSNPPYIRSDDVHLTRGDLRFEPRAALASGADGLAAIRALIAGAPAHLQPGAWLLLEHGYDQGGACRALLEAARFVDVFTAKDLGGNDRVSGGRRAVD